MGLECDGSGHKHSHGELCDVGKELYAKALRTGRIARAEVTAAPA